MTRVWPFLDCAKGENWFADWGGRFVGMKSEVTTPSYRLCDTPRSKVFAVPII